MPSLTEPMSRRVDVDLWHGIYRCETFLIMVVFDCILSFEQVYGKLDGYPRRKKKLRPGRQSLAPKTTFLMLNESWC